MKLKSLAIFKRHILFYTVVETEVAKYKATDDPSKDDIDNYIKDILSGNTIATADNNQLKRYYCKKDRVR